MYAFLGMTRGQVVVAERPVSPYVESESFALLSSFSAWWLDGRVGSPRASGHRVSGASSSSPTPGTFFPSTHDMHIRVSNLSRSLRSRCFLRGG